MFDVLANIFGTSKAVDNILHKDNGLASQVGGWIGRMNYTEEEKAEMRLRSGNLIISRLKALEPFKITQRIIVACVMAIWMLVGLIWLVSIVVGLSGIIEGLKDFVMQDFFAIPSGGVFLLYLTGGVFESARRKQD